MSVQYDQNLWGKVDLLHEKYHREYTHMTNFLEMMTKFQIACSDFAKTLKTVLSKKITLADSKETTLYKSMESFYKCILIHSKLFNETSESFKLTLIEPITKAINESFQKEKDMYYLYSRTRTTYANCKSSLQKIQKEFLARAKECESLVYNAKKTKMYSLANQETIIKLEAKATESIANTALCEDKYINILNETNKARENEINSQKKMQKFYQVNDVEFYKRVKMMTGFFITSLKKMYTGVTIEIDSLADKYNRIIMEKDINDFIEKNKTNAKPDKPIGFIPYKPAAEAINYNKVTSKRKDSVDLNVSLEVIKTFQKIFKYIRTDLNMDEEKVKNRLRLLSNKLFNLENKENLSKKEKDELFGYLKEQNARDYFIKFLSKLKTKGFKNNEKLLNELTEIIFYILELSENEKDYDSAQNCIVLSQTFYNEEKSKKKTYLIDYIRKNRWLNSIEFWEGITDFMIQREITKNDEINKNKNENEKKSNLKNIVFSQVFSYTNNMIDFNINREDILSLVKKFSEKYEIEKEMVDSIIDNINNILGVDTIKEEDKKVKIKDDKNNEYKNIEYKNTEYKNNIEEDKNKNIEYNNIEDKNNIEEEENDINNPEKIEVIKDYFGNESDIKEKEDIKEEEIKEKEEKEEIKENIEKEEIKENIEKEKEEEIKGNEEEVKDNEGEKNEEEVKDNEGENKEKEKEEEQNKEYERENKDKEEENQDFEEEKKEKDEDKKDKEEKDKEEKDKEDKDKEDKEENEENEETEILY